MQKLYLYTHCDPEKNNKSSLNKIFKDGFPNADIFQQIAMLLANETTAAVNSGEESIIKLRSFWSSIGGVKSIDMMTMMLEGNEKNQISDDILLLFGGDEKFVPSHVKNSFL